MERHIISGKDEANYVVCIQELSDELKDCIDKHLVNLVEGHRKIDISLARNNFANKFKKSNKHQAVWISELINHLLLKEKGFTPQFLFKSLDGGGLKKGFDGFYTKDNEYDIWIMECKSNLKDAERVLHKDKLKEANKDLENKFNGKNEKGKHINVWNEAYYQVKNDDVKSPQSLKDKLDSISQNYYPSNLPLLNGLSSHENINDWQLIPSAFIYTNCDEVHKTYNEIYNEISNLVLSGKKNIRVAITFKVFDEIVEYLSTPVGK